MKLYEVACLEGRYWYRVRRPKPKALTNSVASLWEPWQGPCRSAKEAKRQALLAIFGHCPPPGRWGEQPKARSWTGRIS